MLNRSINSYKSQLKIELNLNLKLRIDGIWGIKCTHINSDTFQQFGMVFSKNTNNP